MKAATKPGPQPIAPAKRNRLRAFAGRGFACRGDRERQCGKIKITMMIFTTESGFVLNSCWCW